MEQMDEVLLMGVGGAGTNITSCVAEQIDYPAIAIDTDVQTLANSGFKNRLLLGPALCHGMPARLPAVAGLAAEQSRDGLARAFRDYSKLVVIAGLGGGVGTGATPIIVELAQSLGIYTVVAAVLPLDFEKARRQAAMLLVGELYSSVGELLVYDNTKVPPSTTGNLALPCESISDQAQKIAGDIRDCLS